MDALILEVFNHLHDDATCDSACVDRLVAAVDSVTFREALARMVELAESFCARMVELAESVCESFDTRFHNTIITATTIVSTTTSIIFVISTFIIFI